MITDMLRGAFVIVGGLALQQYIFRVLDPNQDIMAENYQRTGGPLGAVLACVLFLALGMAALYWSTT